MSYCSLDDLQDKIPEDKLIQLTDDDGTGVINQPIIDKAVEDAEAEINSYAEQLYTLPFNPVPKIVRKLAVDITLYHLFSRRGFDSSDESADSIILKRYKDAVKFLENLAKGVVTIGAINQGLPSTSAQPATIQGPPRMFNRRKMEGF
jgi:phage gp36-like protein